MGKVIGFEYDLALAVGINAAVVYNELLFWSTKKSGRKDGWIYKTYEEMTDRLPLSEQTIRRSYKKLTEAGLITTQIKKLDGTPVLHYKLAESETANLVESKETAKLAESLTNTVNNHKTDKPDSENDGTSDISVGANSGAVNVPAAADEAAENARLMDYIISVINPREKPTEPRMRQLRGRLKDGYSRKEIALSAQVLAQSQWHKDNKQMTVDNLLAPSKFGRLFAKIEADSDGQVMTDEEHRAADMARIEKEQAEQQKRNDEFIKAGL